MVHKTDMFDTGIRLPPTREAPKKSEEEEKFDLSYVPWLASFWLSLYAIVPKVNFPGTTINSSFTLASSLVLFGVKTLAENVLQLQFGWPAMGDGPAENPRITWEASASIAGIFHSCSLVPALGVLLSSQPFLPSCKMSVHPQWWQDTATALLQFCTGYMLYDGLINVILVRYNHDNGAIEMTTDDWMFLGHHFATVFYMTGTRVIGAGHISAMTLMFLGEFTNPIFNTYLVAGLAKTMDCCAWPEVHVKAIEILFSIIFILFRSLIGPITCLVLTYDLMISKTGGRATIPLAHRIIWNIMMWGVIIGSIPWIVTCQETLATLGGHNAGVYTGDVDTVAGAVEESVMLGGAEQSKQEL